MLPVSRIFVKSRKKAKVVELPCDELEVARFEKSTKESKED